MRILVHDYSGHPFQVELSRQLAARGHTVTHSHNESYVSGKGRLDDQGQAGLTIVPLRMSSTFAKYSWWTRLRQELVYAQTLRRHVNAVEPDLVVACNIPLLAHFLFSIMQRRVPTVFWQQDVYSEAIGKKAAQALGLPGRAIAVVADRLERSVARRASACVVIAHSFLPVHDRWGTADRVSVIPNWAPLAEIVPRPKDNPWSASRSLAGRPVILYSGTLGLKHNPLLLTQLAERVRRRIPEAVLVVVSEGKGAELIRDAGDDASTIVLPFQPFDELPDVLGSADVLVTLLEPEASAYSVPSKTLSYLCAGRPILALMAPDNPAAQLVREANGLVFDPTDTSLDDAASAVVDLLLDPERATRVGRSSRSVAERRFDISSITDEFEEVFRAAATRQVEVAATTAG